MTAEDLGAASDHRQISREGLQRECIYAALGHPRRRFLLYALSKKTEWSLTELATKIAALEQQVSASAVPEARRKRVYTSLYHTHVPKLAETGVIQYDQNTETVNANENTALLLAVLETISERLDDTDPSS